MKLIINKRFLWPGIGLLILFIATGFINECKAQGDASDHNVSRAKTSIVFNSIFNMRSTGGFTGVQYPAYLGAAKTATYGYYTGLALYCKALNAAGTADTSYSNINISLKPNSLDIIDDGKVYKNYNFLVEGANAPEEYYIGKSQWRDVGLDIESKAMVWGIPKGV